MSNNLTYEMLKEMVIKEMQLSLAGFGIKETGASKQEKKDALQRYITTTAMGKREAKEDFLKMSRGQDVIDEYEPEDSPERNIRTKYYPNWSDEDFKWLLDKIEKMEN